jgi:AraC-like DNA-binding protein
MGMGWPGTFHIGETYAAYFGPSDDNAPHAHAAHQIVLAGDQAATIVDEQGVERTGNRFLIRPLVPHAVQCQGALTLLYIDPQCRLALDLMDHVGSDDICGLAEGILPFNVDAGPAAILSSLQVYAKPQSPKLDHRLADALNDLRANPGNLSIAETASRCGISDGRLRALAREQFGVPLSTWLIWRKLERAAIELAAGATLAESALAGGFSDQAHFSRTMRRMFGVTPKSAMHSLNRFDLE